MLEINQKLIKTSILPNCQQYITKTHWQNQVMICEICETWVSTDNISLSKVWVTLGKSSHPSQLKKHKNVTIQLERKTLRQIWRVALPLQNFDWDLGEISSKISAAKNSPRFSPRSRWDLKIWSKFSPRFSPRSQNLGGQKLAEILAEISAVKNSPRISARFQVRSRWDLKVLAVKNLLRISARLAEISKSWRPKHRTEKTERYCKFVEWSSF